MAYVAATAWQSRGSAWRTDITMPNDRISMGWYKASYATKTYITVIKFEVDTGYYVNSLKIKWTPNGGYGSHTDKTFKIVRPISTAPKIFTTSTTSEAVRPTSESLLQSTTVNNGTEAIITANADVINYLKEGYNYIVLCNFDTEPSGEYSTSYMNGTGAQVEYTTTPYTYSITYNANGGSGTTAAGTKTYNVDYTVAII